MNTGPNDSNSAAVVIRPPQLIQSLVGGFNAVAGNIGLILLPVALDLLLWFGPHLRVQGLFGPTVESMMRFMRENSSTDMLPMITSLERLWKVFLEQYNLLTTLNTFPVGVPSQMAAAMPVKTPLGAAPSVDITGFGQFLLGWLGLTLAGFFLGSLYFAIVARACGKGAECSADALEASTPASVPGLRLRTLAWETVQVIALVILLLIIVLVLMIPTMLMAMLLSLISPMIAQIALLLVAFSLVWFLAPLIFSPHGIFLCGQSVLNAMMNSTRVVRLSLPGTALFLLVVIILNQGLGLLWNSPPETSWMALIGILGHAFISTGLLAASFFYYRGGLKYMQALRRAAVTR